MGKQSRERQQKRQQQFERVQRERERMDLQKQGRLYDLLMSILASDNRFRPVMRDAAVYDNSLLFEQHADADGAIYPSQLPYGMPLRLPSDTLFFEQRNIQGDIVHDSLGVLVTWGTLEDLTPDYINDFGKLFPPKTYAIMWCWTWVGYYGDFVAEAIVPLDENYRLISGEMILSTIPRLEQYLAPKDVEAVKNTQYWDTVICLNAIALMNCRNIELVDHIPDPDISRRYEREFGVPLTTYKTLRIKPMGKRYERDDQPHEYQDIMPLHIRRGHFATYTDDAPLFGKYTGTFWRPATAVGNEKNGIRVKDYKVEAAS